ncbi:hypothetical protein [Acetobacter senegalensis]|uniref:hypothetical protein n=1 Tax=Acetobacter senegalensis TaxID=446692 RepID=UPI001EDC4CA0|nr:hypothetical protein [Acetobacter senegalensis]
MVEAGIFGYSAKKTDVPDLQFHFMAESKVSSVPKDIPCTTLNSYTLRPKSRETAYSWSGCIRICDNSVIPSIIGSNTKARTIMLAERKVYFIRGNA